MQKLLLLLVLGSIMAISCQSEQKGCPSSNYYSNRNIKQNKHSSKQMSNRVF
ncbi:hypothetical protein [Chitinophaga silvisoli]|uniref:hypothetical protein n=1 Tax=Chitinophaga silvisoli TaxID=2291814 RepID=UPI001314C639|nr:hypothetical protein [Chitinophaga silvisoli]